MLVTGILTAEVTAETITGNIIPSLSPEKVTSEALPIGLTVIEAGLAVTVKAPIYNARDWIADVGNALIVITSVAKSG